MCEILLFLLSDSLYHKRLSVDGRQLNLEVFDPCSQVQMHHQHRTLFAAF